MGLGFRGCEGTEGTEELSNQNQRAGTERRRVRRRAELSFLVSISFVWVIFLLTLGELWELRLTGLSNVLMCGPMPPFFPWDVPSLGSLAHGIHRAAAERGKVKYSVS